MSPDQELALAREVLTDSQRAFAAALGLRDAEIERMQVELGRLRPLLVELQRLVNAVEAFDALDPRDHKGHDRAEDRILEAARDVGRQARRVRQQAEAAPAPGAA